MIALDTLLTSGLSFVLLHYHMRAWRHLHVLLTALGRHIQRAVPESVVAARGPLHNLVLALLISGRLLGLRVVAALRGAIVGEFSDVVWRVCCECGVESGLVAQTERATPYFITTRNAYCARNPEQHKVTSRSGRRWGESESG